MTLQERLRLHPDNKTKQAMQHDCERAADEIEKLERELAAAQEANAQLVKERDAAFAMSRCECQSEECCRNLVQAQEARQRAEEQVLSRIIGIATVGNIDGHEVIRRQSAIDVVRMVFAAIDAAREGK